MSEDDIDTETLQAQIDMSLSFAQDLVSSWIKPLSSPLKKATSSKDAEKELEEILRRPARLGVGAPLPEATSVNGRDNARLKNKLAGSKRPREEEASISKANGKTVDDDDDAEESRAGAIRKKVKVDPFQVRKKKGKGKELDDKAKEEDAGKKKISMEGVEGTELGEEAVHVNENQVQNKAVSEAMDADEDVDGQTAAKSTESKRKKKKKNKHIPANLAVGPGPDAPDDAPHTSTSLSAMTPAHAVAAVLISPSSPSNVPTSMPNPTTPATPKPPLSAKRNPFVLPDAPILNLSRSPPHIDTHNMQTDQTSPKKKRRRKKKKKVKVEQAKAVSSDEES